jgi:hypothetical protein
MINIKAKKCIENNCYSQPNFNYENEKRGIYCSEHKKEGMINITVLHLFSFKTPNYRS